MLRELAVSNFAIIRNLEVSFQPGMNVLTGETGAGKSILVGAVNLILGSRASQEMIRSGMAEATVEAIFSVNGGDGFKARMEGLGLEIEENLVIRRSISRSGRNRVFVNDQSVSLQQLQQLAKGLISVSGQHEHQLLLDEQLHLGLLDAFGGLENQLGEVSVLYSQWAAAQDELRKFRKFKQERAAHLEWVRFQLGELEAARLQPGEDTALEQERNLLRHAETLHESAESVYRSLYAGRGAVLEQLAEVERNLSSITHIDSSQAPLNEYLEQARIQLQELAHAAQTYGAKITHDPQRLAAIEERTALLQRLGKKYGGTLDSMLDKLGELRATVALDGDAGEREDELTRRIGGLRLKYLAAALELSSLRRETGVKLAREVMETLSSVDMPKARFAVGFMNPESEEPADSAFTASGVDVLEFLLSANPGEDLKSLARVASGGELSRILLALKSLLSRQGEAETLIFDEVDAGIGGRTADLVGLQLHRLSNRHQVICITHLPQIACYGAHHYKVLKSVTDGETATEITPLMDGQRLEEVARMLGGISISEKTRAHARELLENCPKGP